jgi:hypothetical protein
VKTKLGKYPFRFNLRNGFALLHKRKLYFQFFFLSFLLISFSQAQQTHKFSLSPANFLLDGNRRNGTTRYTPGCISPNAFPQDKTEIRFAHNRFAFFLPMKKYNNPMYTKKQR